MFDLPEAKRIRRADLYTRSSSTSPPPSPPADPELEAQLRERLASIYGPISIIPPTDPTQEHEQEPEPLPQTQQGQEQEFEFRLFSTPKTKDRSDSAQKIILKEPEEELGEGHFVVRERDRRFYISAKAHGEELARYQASAVSGEDILKARGKRAWGLEVPWRVTILRSTASPSSNSKPIEISISKSNSGTKVGKKGEGKEERQEGAKKIKPNKKRRIVLRERKKKRDTAEENRRKEREERDEKEREKKTRRNREKKVKRKLKEKAKKVEGDGGGEEKGVVENGNESVD